MFHTLVGQKYNISSIEHTHLQKTPSVFSPENIFIYFMAVSKTLTLHA